MKAYFHQCDNVLNSPNSITLEELGSHKEETAQSGVLQKSSKHSRKQPKKPHQAQIPTPHLAANATAAVRRTDRLFNLTCVAQRLAHRHCYSEH